MGRAVDVVDAAENRRAVAPKAEHPRLRVVKAELADVELFF
jgi:hypothetical protein